MPPEVAEEARRYCKKLGLWRRRYIQDVEDELRLQYYFGGQAVGQDVGEGAVLGKAARVDEQGDPGNALKDGVTAPGEFDVVVGNPPWGQKQFRFAPNEAVWARARFR